MNSYLDGIKDSNIILRNGPYVYIERPDLNDGDGEILHYMEYDHTDGRLWINKYFLNVFNEMFAMEMKDSENFIRNWFESRFDVKIEFVE